MTLALAATVDAAMQLPGQVLEAWVPLAQKLQADRFERRVLVVESIEQTLTAWHEQWANPGEASVDTVSNPLSNLSGEHRHELHRRLDLLAGLASNLRGEDFSSRFRLAVNQAIWDRKLGASVDDAEAAIALNLEPLAREVIAQPALLENEWAWLTSNLEWRAVERWFEVLGRSDAQRTVAESLEHIATQMPNAIPWRSLYELSFARTYLDEQHIDDLLNGWFEHRETSPLIIDLLFRAGYSVQRGHLLNQLVNEGVVSHLQPFAFGLWGRAIPVEVALQIATTAAAKVDIPQVVSFVRMYLLQVPDALPALRDLALQLLLDEQSMPTGSSTRNDWAELAELYAGDAPQPILAATLKRLVQDNTGRSDALRVVIERAWEVSDKDQLFVNVVGPALEESGVNGWRLGRVLSTLPLGELTPATLLSWVAAQPEKRATSASDFVGPPVGRPTHLQAELLEQFRVYGVGASFARNLLSGTWSGAGVKWVRERMALVPEWLADERPAVRDWAREIQEILESELKRFQQWDEEERFE